MGGVGVAEGTFIHGRTGDASVGALTGALVEHRPAIVVTQQPRADGPPDQPGDAMAERLGVRGAVAEA